MSAPRKWRSEPALLGDDRLAALAGLPPSRHAQSPATGQLTHAGFDAVQTSAPSSITATDHLAALFASAGGSSDSASLVSATLAELRPATSLPPTTPPTPP